MYLEEITYYKNMCCPQFTPINYLFDREYCFDNDNAKAVMLSELPAIFKKYNIPLCRDDLLLFLNPGFKHLQNIKTVETIEKWLFFCQIFVFYLAYNTRTML